MSNGGIDKWHKVIKGKQMTDAIIDQADKSYPQDTTKDQQLEYLKTVGDRLLNEVLRDDSDSPKESIEEALK